MKNLTFTGTASTEVVEREVVLTLKNTSEEDQKVILIDSPALKDEKSQEVRPIAFGTEKKISFNDSGEQKRYSDFRSFGNLYPVHIKSISIESDSNAQTSEDVILTTPVLLSEPIVEKIEPVMRKNGSDYDCPAQLFTGQGTEVSFNLKAGISARVIIKLGAYDAARLI